MPKLSDSMEEGTIVRWVLSDGGPVTSGDELVEIETDKATMVYEAEASGILHIQVPEGDTVSVGALIGHLVAVGEGPGTTADPAPDVPSANGHGDGRDVLSPSLQASRIAPAPSVGALEAVSAPGGGQRIKASPVARRVAVDLGVDLATVSGSGPTGRVTKQDVLGSAAGQALSEATVPTPEDPTHAARGTVRRERLSRLQATVARRMSEATATVPEFTVSVDVDMEAAVALRARFKEAEADITPSFNDFVVKACALALRRHPRANGAYIAGAFELYERVNVGLAVAGPDALLVPTLFDADRKSIGQIAREARALAERGRAGSLTPHELAGGTFTVSNLGMFGVKHFTAVINPPQAAILAVGHLEQRAVVRDAEIVAGARMTITLSCDHRILYGADAAAFLADIRAGLEHPLRLAL